MNKEYIFYKDEYIEKYLDIIEQNKTDYDFDIIAFCMMNNHGHFLVYTENMNDFGKFMQKTNLHIEEDNRESCNEYILEGIREFEDKFSYNTIEIFSQKTIDKNNT